MRSVILAIVIAGIAAAALARGPASQHAMTDRELPAPRLGVVEHRFAILALACIHRPYPNKIAHVLSSDADALPPRQLTPMFYGCFDWHSSVHGHWLLARILNTDPATPLRPVIEAALAESFRKDRVAGEVAYLNSTERQSFERPYGLAWFLQLVAELQESPGSQAANWRDTLRPLESVIVGRVMDWLPKLRYPIRVGTHNQTAFAFGLFLDYARSVGDEALAEQVRERSLAFYRGDRNCPLGYEPSGEDFLSPCLMEADLMRRVLPGAEFARWLNDFLPGIPRERSADWLSPGVVTDPTDGKLAHLDGVNLSRAWALEGIASALPADDARRPALLASAELHRELGVAAVSDEHYAGSHWLGSFATYLTTRRGIAD